MPKYSDYDKKYSKHPIMKFLEKNLDPKEVNKIRDLDEQYPQIKQNIEKNTPVPYNPKYVSEKLMSQDPADTENSDIINRMLKSIVHNDPYSDYNLDSLNDHEEFFRKYPDSKNQIIHNLEDVKSFELSPQGKFKGLINMLKNR